MPIGPYENFATCVAAQQEKGRDEEQAKKICGTIEANMTKMLVLRKSAEEQCYTLGVVYEPDVVDTEGDFAKAETIESAAWAFMERLQTMAKGASTILKSCLDAEGEGITLDVTELTEMAKADGLDDQHLQVDEPLGTIVESYLAPTDLDIGGQQVKKGAWLLGVRWTPEMFTKIKSGERTGLSMFGRLDRVKGVPVGE